MTQRVFDGKVAPFVFCRYVGNESWEIKRCNLIIQQRNTSRRVVMPKSNGWPNNN